VQGPRDPHGDLAAVGDQHAGEHGGLSDGARMRISWR
jgi:hypothetical protein